MNLDRPYSFCENQMNAQCKTVTIVDENRNLSDLGLENEFFRQTPKALSMKEKLRVY